MGAAFEMHANGLAHGANAATVDDLDGSEAMSTCFFDIGIDEWPDFRGWQSMQVDGVLKKRIRQVFGGRRVEFVGRHVDLAQATLQPHVPEGNANQYAEDPCHAVMLAGPVQGGNVSIAYDCVVFDLDGTVLDSHDYTFAGFRHALAPWNQCPSDEQIHAAFGPPERVILETFLPVEALDNAYERLQSWYREQAHRAQPHPEMLQVLEFLQTHDIVAGLFTGRAMDSTRMLLQAHGLERFFAAVIAGDSPVRPKPSGEGILELLRTVGCRTQRALVVGDSRLDLQAAEQAGVQAVGVSWFASRALSKLTPPTLAAPSELLRLLMRP